MSQDSIGNLMKRQGNSRDYFSYLAQGISIFGFAPVLSVPTFILIILSARVGSNFAIDLGIALLFGFLLPSLTMYFFVKMNGISYNNRESRLVPLLSVAVEYLLGTVVFSVLSEPASATILLFCYGTNTLAIYLISLKWKISVHAMGVAGPTTALIFSIGTAGGLLGLLMLPVAWSRLYLKKHTPGQVVYGGLLGYVLTSIQFTLILNFVYHESTEGLFVLLTIVVLVLPLIAFAYYSSPAYFRYCLLFLILFSLLLGYLIAYIGLIVVNYLLAALLISFVASLFLPVSIDSTNRIFQNLFHGYAEPD